MFIKKHGNTILVSGPGTGPCCGRCRLALDEDKNSEIVICLPMDLHTHRYGWCDDFKPKTENKT